MDHSLLITKWRQINLKRYIIYRRPYLGTHQILHGKVFEKIADLGLLYTPFKLQLFRHGTEIFRHG